MHFSRKKSLALLAARLSSQGWATALNRPLLVLAPLLLLVVALLTATGGIQSALGQPGPSVADDNHGHHIPAITEDQALAKIAQMYAAEYGVPLGEATRRMSLQLASGPILEDIERAAGARLAGMWLEHEGEYRIVVSLVGDEPMNQDLARMKQTSKVPMEVRLSAKFSILELEQARDAALKSAGAKFKVAGIGIDVRSGTVSLHVELTSDNLAELQGEAASLSIALGVPVKAEAIPNSGTDDHTYGGKALTTCTTAFTVSNYASTTGVLTAGHCTNSQTYYESGSISYPLTFLTQSYGTVTDVQWHTDAEGHTEYAKYFDGGSLISVNQAKSRTEQMVGWYVCHYAKTTLTTCGTLIDKNYVPNYTNPDGTPACPGGPCSPVWMRVTGSNLACSGGDSGGPWFFGGWALGVHKGSPSNSCIYMAINYITYMAVFVLTE